MWAFFNGSCISTHIMRVQKNRSWFAQSDLHCACNVIDATRTKIDMYRWPETEVFACLLTKNPANASDTDSPECYSQRLHCATMVEVNVERENPRSHNPRSCNPIGSTISVYRIPKRSRLYLQYRLSFKTLHLFSLSCFPSTNTPLLWRL